MSVFLRATNTHLRLMSFMEVGALAYVMGRTWKKLPLGLGRLQDLLERLQVPRWKLVLGVFGLTRVYARLSLLLGMNAPHTSLVHEPDVHYSPSFSRVRWLLTAMDAGVLTTMNLPKGFFRDALSLLLGVYYLFFIHKAEVKLLQFRNSLEVRHIRRMWEKGMNPIVHFVTNLLARKCRISGKKIVVPRSVSNCDALMSPTTCNKTAFVGCQMYYDKPINQLAGENKMILHIPGGGFIAMTPSHHQDYLNEWAIATKVPIISIDYRKAPENPYPCGLNDVFDVYQTLVKTKGKVLGMNINSEDFTIILCGDSAGGNLCCGVTLRCIESGLQKPHGLHLIYPALDMVGGSWLDPSVDPIPTSMDGKQSISYAISSRAKYAFDGVLPFKYQLVIAENYLRLGGDPHSDPYISPLRAKEELLAEFPQCCVHVGSVDPLLDDSLSFVHRLRQCGKQPVALRIIPKVSHAYMHVTTLLPEGKMACNVSIGWLKDMLKGSITDNIRRSSMYDLGVLFQQS
jgi:acetyl esterase/lipase